MKKIFTLICTILIAISASADYSNTYNYKCGPTEVVVTDLSTPTRSQFKLAITQKAKNTAEYTKETLYDNTVELIINPDEHSIVGTFTTDDYTIDANSFLKSGSNTRYVSYWENSTITIVSMGGNKYAITDGLLQVENSNNTTLYKYDYCYDVNDLNDQAAEKTAFEFTFGEEPTPATWDTIGTSSVKDGVVASLLGDMTDAPAYNVTTLQNGTNYKMVDLFGSANPAYNKIKDLASYKKAEIEIDATDANNVTIAKQKIGWTGTLFSEVYEIEASNGKLANGVITFAAADIKFYEDGTAPYGGYGDLVITLPSTETKIYAKNNWNGEDWTWKEMTKSDENVYTLDRVVFGGTGVLINSKEDDADAKWFDLDGMTYVNGKTIQAKDTVRFDLTISQENTVLTATLLGRPAPVARKEFSFVAGEAADSDPAMFAITWGADGSNETVPMSKKEDDIYVAEILPTVDSVVLVRCAAGATEIIWGEGTNVLNQTRNYLLSDTMYFGGWEEDTYLFTLTSEPPKPVEAKYYAKNNWDGEEDYWTWKEMTKSDENVYTLERVVFGGTGVNINTKEEDADALWFDLKKMTYVNDTIQKMDTVRFVLTISQEDTVLTATLLGRPAPVARKEFVFVAGAAADSDPVMFAITWGADGSNETVPMSKKEDDIYVAEILSTVDSVVLVRCATGATKIIWDGEGKNVWNQTANYPLSDTMYFGEWTEEGLFTLTNEPPKPAPKVDKTGIIINGRKYGFPVRLVKEVPTN